MIYRRSRSEIVSCSGSSGRFVLFYGFLLLFVPVVRALQGELPIELSTRGARYADASDDVVRGLGDRLDQIEQLLDRTIEFVNRLADRVTGLASERDVRLD